MFFLLESIAKHRTFRNRLECLALRAKINLFAIIGTQEHKHPIPRPLRGRIAIVTTRGAGCGGRERRGRRMRRAWTVKPCGPVPSTLGSSSRVMIPRATAANKPRRRGEHGAAGQPLRRECRTVRRPVVTMLVRFFCFACQAAGAACTRHSLHLRFSRGWRLAKPGRFSRRGNENVCLRHCERSEAIHGAASSHAEGWIASSLRSSQ